MKDKLDEVVDGIRTVLEHLPNYQSDCQGKEYALYLGLDNLIDHPNGFSALKDTIVRGVNRTSRGPFSITKLEYIDRDNKHQEPYVNMNLEGQTYLDSDGITKQSEIGLFLQIAVQGNESKEGA